MIKRVLCLMAAIMVASSSAMAWTADSFIGNDYDEQDTYDFEPVYGYPMQPMRMMSARSTASASDNLLLDWSNWSFSTIEPVYVRYYTYSYYIPSVGTTDMGPYPDAHVYPIFFDRIPSDTVGMLSFISPVVSVPSIEDLYDSNYSSDFDVTRSYMSSFSVDYIYTFDEPVEDFSSVEFVYSLLPYYFGSFSYPDGSYNYIGNYSDCEISIYLDDHFVTSGPAGMSTGSLIFNAYSSFSSITIRVTYGQLNTTPVILGSYNSQVWGGFQEGSFFSLNIIGRDSALDGFNNQAQDDINQHNAIESEWTGSMTSNFNALSIETFAFPSGLISAFGLITGIFNDLWNGMGEYKIAYVFPLTLGIALLLIGRISKFDGGQSSGKRNRGDDGA